MMLRFFVSLLSGFTSYPPEYILAVPFRFLITYQYFLRPVYKCIAFTSLIYGELRGRSFICVSPGCVWHFL